MRCRIGQAQGVWEVEGSNPATSKPRLKEGLWSPDEDNQLTSYIMRKGLVSCWNYVAKQAGLQRCGKSCRLRWINYLRPGLKRHPISWQEERLIIKLQSILGNRWSQIAAQMPGRTDNGIKNYWNSSIKRKLRVKPYTCSSTAPIASGDINRKINIHIGSDRICNEFGRIGSANSMAACVHGHVTSPRSVQPYLGAMPEGYQPHNSAFNVVTTGDNLLCVPEVLEFKKEESQDQNDELLIDPNPNNLLNSYSHLWINDNLTHTHESFSTNATFMSSSLQEEGLHNYKAAKSATTKELIIESCRSTVATYEAPASANNCFVDSIRIAIPDLAERQLLNQHIENDGQINRNLIMNDYSSVTTPSTAGHSYACSAADFPDVYPGVSYITNDHELLGIMEDHRDGHKSYQLPYREGRGDGIGDQLGCSESNVNPIPAIIGGGTGALDIHKCNGVAGEVTIWADEDMYNISNAAASDFFDDIYDDGEDTTHSRERRRYFRGWKMAIFVNLISRHLKLTSIELLLIMEYI